MLENRFILGGIIGIAYGDAYGMPVEMFTQEEIYHKYGYISKMLPGDPENDISKGFPAGSVTDDTMNSIFVLEMLRENGNKADPVNFLNKLRYWAAHSENSKTVIGPSTRKAIQLIDEGISISETGKTGTTNGASMKIVPIGLAGNPEQPEVLADEVEKMCLPTHNTTYAISGACAIAGAVCLARSGESSVDQIVEFAVEMAERGSMRGFPTASPSVAERIRLACRIVDNADSDQILLKQLYQIIGTSVITGESVPVAVALFKASGGDPVKCARYAANIGGDTDTIGAMACGICGSYSGADAFPSEEVQLIESINNISFVELAACLVADS
jgi:ADP-ribosylglycohydrolase